MRSRHVRHPGVRGCGFGGHVPDQPVSSFRLKLFGGKRGLIEMSSGFCANPRATVSLTAQNNRQRDFTPKVGAKCPGGKSARKPGRGHRSRR